MANVILLNVAAPKIRRCRRAEMVRQRQEIPFKPKKRRNKMMGPRTFPEWENLDLLSVIQAQFMTRGFWLSFLQCHQHLVSFLILFTTTSICLYSNLSIKCLSQAILDLFMLTSLTQSSMKSE